MNINWDELKAKAIKVMANAYVPYSKFPVGVAALVDDGRDRKSTRLNSSHIPLSRMPSSA